MIPHWFKDSGATKAFGLIESEVGQPLMRLFPGYQMTHCGFSRSDVFDQVRELDEVVVNIHMRRIGEAQMIRMKLETQDTLRDFQRLSRQGETE